MPDRDPPHAAVVVSGGQPRLIHDLLRDLRPLGVRTPGRVVTISIPADPTVSYLRLDVSNNTVQGAPQIAPT